jgi:methylthioribose-1-phosphate isomerase
MAVNRQLIAVANEKIFERKVGIAKQTAIDIADEDAASCQNIGSHGVAIIEKIAKKKKGETVNILTHCNAGGWLLWTMVRPPAHYEAVERGIKVHVWVDETRPRNQGLG